MNEIGQLLRLASAKYDPSTDTVTLTPASPLALNQIYQINVNGAGTITDIAGNRLDGDANGRSGGSFSGTFGYGRTLSYADNNNDLVSFSLRGPGNLKITSLNNAVTVDVRVAGIALAIAVEILLGAVGDLGAVVDAALDAVAVVILVGLARIAHAVLVEIVLVRVEPRRAVVRARHEAITVRVAAARVGGR